MKKTISSITILLFVSAIYFQALAYGKDSQKVNCIDAVVGGAYLTFADKFGGEINREELRSTTELGVAGCAAGSKIYTFKLVIKSSGNIKRFSGESYVLSSEILKSLKSLQPGDSFEFTEIKAHLPTGSRIDALGRLFTVV